MPILEIRAQCSDVLHAVIEAMRGDIPREDFLMHALAVGLGHMQEEVLTRHRNNTYEKLTIASDQFGKALELHKLVHAGTPSAPPPFGQDITRRPKVVG